MRYLVSIVLSMLITLLLSPLLLSLFEDAPLRDPFTYYIQWEDTLYAKGFTESKFSSIEKGQSKDYVKELLGKPISIFYRCGTDIEAVEMHLFDNTWFTYDKRLESKCNDFTDTWRYSVAGPRSNYFFVRNITFDQEGRVVLVSARFED